ncbi:MAG: hypothetical protein WKF66_05170 [Pedobacter sp.]
MITYSHKITLTPESLKDIYGSDDSSKRLEVVLSGSTVLYTLILDYEYGKGNLSNVKLIENSLVMNSEATGSFRVSYDINEFSVCSALDYTGVYSMLLNFVLNWESAEIVLTGEDRYE